LTEDQFHLDEQVFDEKIGAAFHDVPIPPGLYQRIIVQLAQTRSERWIVRRRMFLAGGLLSAAAVLFAALWFNLPGDESYTEQTVLDEAIRFFDGDTTSGGILLTEISPPDRYPFSRSVLYSNAIRWREIKMFLGRACIAYDLTGHDAVRATLYVIELGVAGLGNEPRFQPFTTGGDCASVWQENGLLYILVVQGGLRTYQNYLNLPSGPVA
jgi:hypothetical protein